MRLWSLHPQYLDPAGLVALWREGLLAQAVLGGRTSGYTRHPQLLRFRLQSDPLASLGSYLHSVADEADRRGYSFAREKLPLRRDVGPINLTEGQLHFEWSHLKTKLRSRSPVVYAELDQLTAPLQHPVFVIVPGLVESWEKASRGER